jgi:hypothetical protein
VKIEWQIVPILITCLYSWHGICFTITNFCSKKYVKLNNGKSHFEYDAYFFTWKVIYAEKLTSSTCIIISLWKSHCLFSPYCSKIPVSPNGSVSHSTGEIELYNPSMNSCNLCNIQCLLGIRCGLKSILSGCTLMRKATHVRWLGHT